MSDDYVSIGTALPAVNDDEFIPKPVRYQEMVAKDEKGRRRFHGAFTGGFSAGYFNSVGTKEGWAPSHFSSSREKRGELPAARPESFMDEEDFGEHGIAPRKLAVTKKFDTKKRKSEPVSANKTDSLLHDLIVPAQSSIGAKLLQKLGWREGQGIGPRIRKKVKKTNKIYGCSMNPQSDSDDDYPSNVTFAPKDIPPIKLQPKDDVKGLGYKGVEQSNRFELFPVPSKEGTSRSSKKGMLGSAFGVGALEEDDDQPVYDFDTLENYNSQIGSDNEEEEPRIPTLKPDAAAPMDFIGIMLEGFSLSTINETQVKTYPPPEIPKGYRPRQHIVEVKQEPAERVEEGEKSLEGKPAEKTKITSLNAHSRGHLLGEKPEIKSVFDIIPDKDKAKLSEAIKKVKNQGETIENKSRFDIKTLSNRFVSSSQKDDDEDISKKASKETSSISNRFVTPAKTAEVKEEKVKDKEEEAKAKVGVASVTEQRNYGIALCGVSSFKPFSSDPEKQARYERFKKAINEGVAYTVDSSSRMTEWEIDREKEEFSRANRLYVPMSRMMSSRFTTAQYADDETDVKLPDANEQTDEEKAVKMKMFGRFTRKTFEWHPDRLLCKRFNVPNPYPDSDIVGLPNVKRDKYSVFNLLSFHEGESPATVKSERNVEQQEVKKEKVEERGEKSKVLPLTLAVDVFEKDKERRAKQKEVNIAKNLEEISNISASDKNKSEEMETGHDSVKDEDDDIEPLPPRPPMDLFASIFGDDDDKEDAPDESSITHTVDEVMETFDIPDIQKSNKNDTSNEVTKGDRTRMMEKSAFSKFLINSKPAEDRKIPEEIKIVKEPVVYEGPSRPPPSHIYKAPSPERRAYTDGETESKKHKKKKEKKSKHSKKKKHKSKH
ncbi:unnamed protein product [Dimorphilus gyrociliatus]|uniref:G-patch domain-containing protein n=1 Tax=Dimorphilus gyrociliatus TaxID=2664684 RepID=A0A7I8VH40_9ANNE|nr:unnamed protein product [Dimorphilus gyrociliatus]